MVLSSLWALVALGVTVIGILVVVSTRDSNTSLDLQGFGDFVGGALAVIGVFVLGAAVGGIVLGVKANRGSRGAATALGVLFMVFAAVSGVFFVSTLTDQTGVAVRTFVVLGLNTAVCVAVAALALAGRDAREGAHPKT